MEIWTEGDKLQAICESCGDVVDATYRYRTVHLEKSDIDVPNVLVGVCDTCDAVVSIPHQSAPRLKAAREQPAEKVEYRLPHELDDVLNLIADELDANTQTFTPALIKYYMGEFIRDAGFRRRIGRLAQSRLAKTRARSRSAFRAPVELMQAADRGIAEVDLENRADLVRGIIVAAKEDVLDNRAPRRREDLSQIAGVL